jgi:membrane-associated phospholipid phosphatase
MANRLARWVSILFDSSILSLPVFLVIGWHEAGAAGLRWAILTLLILTGIPLAYLVIGKKVGWVSDFELSERRERPRFIAVSLSSDALALWLLTSLGSPHLLRVMTLTYLCLGVTMFTISSFWKISLHMVGVSGFATALTFVYGPAAVAAFLALLLVGWARLHRRKHTPAQLVGGALAGALITALVFGWLGR